MWFIRISALIITGIFLLTTEGVAQEKNSVATGRIVTAEGDTLPHINIRPVVVVPRRTFNSHADVRKYWRLAMKVKKVYPYAQKAAELLSQYEMKYLSTNDKKLRRQYVRQAEEELFDQYGPQLKKLSISEGRILIKLIDRETKHTSYELIKDLKGGLSAFFWQGVAKVFGNNLKEEYDPVTEDRLIEEIIFYIEVGVI